MCFNSILLAGACACSPVVRLVFCCFFIFFLYCTIARETQDGNGAVSGQISVDFGSCRFGFGNDFLPTVFGFGTPKPIGFGFPSVDIQWISKINHLKLKLIFYNMLIITCLLILLNLF